LRFGAEESLQGVCNRRHLHPTPLVWVLQNGQRTRDRDRAHARATSIFVIEALFEPRTQLLLQGDVVRSLTEDFDVVAEVTGRYRPDVLRRSGGGSERKIRNTETGGMDRINQNRYD